MAVGPEASPWLPTSRVVAATVIVLSATWACSAPATETIGSARPAAEPARPVAPASTAPRGTTREASAPAPRTTGAVSPKPSRPTTPSPEGPPRVLASDGKPREARLTIPALDLEDLQVQPHRGSPDDARGTRIQNRGIAASPFGPDGGVGPGGVGNHIVTAHRLSSTRAFLDLPRLRVGAKVHLDAGGERYTYRIVKTRITSFRSKKSLAAQSASVPGRPGVRATKAMITLSTCRTPEDHAEGNYWSDELGNPEHRIDKIGELVAIRPV